MSEVKITYETLFALLRREKSREELQELDAKFFDDIVKYVNEKTDLFKRQEGSLNNFMDSEKDRAEKQIYNIKRIIKEIYDRREKKIIEMAINKSRTKSNIINTNTMLTEEKLMFEFLVSTLDRFRQGILFNTLEGKETVLETDNMNVEKEEEKEEVKESEEKKEECSGDEVKEGIKCVKILHAIPKFVGKNLETYGPFEEGDQVELPSEIVGVLLNKGRAEEISKITEAGSVQVSEEESAQIHDAVETDPAQESAKSL